MTKERVIPAILVWLFPLAACVVLLTAPVPLHLSSFVTGIMCVLLVEVTGLASVGFLLGWTRGGISHTKETR